jgi:hypothetical protein
VATLVQAFAAVAVYRAIRGIDKKAAPVIGRISPVLDRIEATFLEAGPVLEKIGVVAEKTGPVIERIGPMMAQVGPVVEKMGPAVVQAGLILENANKLLAETRPKIARISDDVAGIARSGREQVDRAGDFLRDAGNRAIARLDQIDRTVESTVAQVEQASEVVKRAVMTPVREVNGIAAGISAAVSTLVHHPRRPQIDQATQDEEMFI